MKFVAATSALTFITATAHATDDILNVSSSCPTAPLPTIFQASIEIGGVQTFANTTQAAEGTLDRTLSKGYSVSLLTRAIVAN